jgi:hypothetical protein
MQDVMAGHVPSMFGNLGEQLGAIKAGRTRALAVTSLKRHFSIPDSPTFRPSMSPASKDSGSRPGTRAACRRACRSLS